jgi:hypothetical protein
MTPEQPVSLADQITAAEQAAAGPQQQVAVLRAGLQSAVASSQFDEAHRLQGELDAARQTAALAESQVTALRSAATRIEHERTVEAREIAEAQDRDLAARDLAAAMEDEERGKAKSAASISELWDAVGEASRRLAAAHAADGEITAARLRIVDARRRLGHWPASDPGPTPARANEAAILAEQNPLIRALAGWRR